LVTAIFLLSKANKSSFSCSFDNLKFQIRKSEAEFVLFEESHEINLFDKKEIFLYLEYNFSIKGVLELDKTQVTPLSVALSRLSNKRN
jgi:hypothetical protein